MEILLIQAINPLIKLFIFNIYVAPHNKSNFNLYKNQIEAWLADMILQRPNSMRILSGDFNTSSQPLKSNIFRPNRTPKYTWRRKRNGLNTYSITDWTFTNSTKNLFMKSKFHNTRCSDHTLIINDIETQYTTKPPLIAIPSKKNALSLCNEASKSCENFNDFYNKFMKLKESSKLFTLHRQKLHPVKQKYTIPDDNIFDVLNNKLFTKEFGYAHKLLNKLTILYPDKREGGITNCIKLPNNEFITAPKEIIYSCLNVLSSIQIDTKYDSSIPISSLPPIDIKIAKELQTKMSRSKGDTGDEFSDTWFAKTKLTHLLTDLQTSEIFKLFPDFGEARLIPLNKVWPNTPTPEQFRPITILSPLYKWLETRLIDKLNDYQVCEMKREQIGFLPNMSTLTNIRKMI